MNSPERKKAFKRAVTKHFDRGFFSCTHVYKAYHSLRMEEKWGRRHTERGGKVELQIIIQAMQCMSFSHHFMVSTPLHNTFKKVWKFQAPLCKLISWCHQAPHTQPTLSQLLSALDCHSMFQRLQIPLKCKRCASNWKQSLCLSNTIFPENKETIPIRFQPVQIKTDFQIKAYKL